jgi:CubicO group peptidase (beta-lactamase class C family)
MFMWVNLKCAHQVRPPRGPAYTESDAVHGAVQANQSWLDPSNLARLCASNVRFTSTEHGNVSLRASLRGRLVVACGVVNERPKGREGYGLANTELSVPASAHTIFELASLTKPFSAVAIMMLAEEGRISLDDRLPKYFAGAPASWTSVSVEHLLRHTSGFGDFFAIPELRSNPNPVRNGPTAILGTIFSVSSLRRCQENPTRTP